MKKTCDTCIFLFKSFANKDGICEHPTGACKTKKLEKHHPRDRHFGGGIINTIDSLNLKALIEIQKIIVVDYLLMNILSIKVQNRINLLTPKEPESMDNAFVKNGAVISGSAFQKIYNKAKDEYKISTFVMRSKNNLATAEIKRFKLGGIMDKNKISFNQKYSLVVMTNRITNKGTAFFYKSK